MQTHILNRNVTFVAIGRIPPANETLARSFMLFEHASLSRKHAMILANPLTRQVMLFDHGSTHGTFVNRRIVRPGEYHELNDGDMVSFGESTRIMLVKVDDGQEDSGEEATPAPAPSQPI